MKLEEFKDLFVRSLEVAADNAEKELGRHIPRKYEIRLHGVGHSGDIVEIDNAAVLLFIDEEYFYRIIDVAVQKVSPHVSTIFIRVSGHEPVHLEQTWDPQGSGPFKQIMAQIQEVSS